MIDVGTARLRSQRVSAAPLSTPAEVVRWMGAMQAQDYRQVLWAIGRRTHDCTVREVEAAIAAGEIVLTWPMRGTIHAVAGEDVRWMLAAFTPRIVAAARRTWSPRGLDDGTMEHAAGIANRELQEGRCLTRTALLGAFEAHGIEAANGRGYHILTFLAQTGVLCFGPRSGHEQTFVLLDDWVSPVADIPREEALARVALRFFRSHGPASDADLARWAGIGLREARAGRAAAGDSLVRVTAGERDLWMDRDVAAEGVAADSGFALLPGFDEFLLGYRDRSDVLSADGMARVVPGSNGIFAPIVVHRGRVTGTWRRKERRGALEVALEPFSGEIVPEGSNHEITRFTRFIQGHGPVPAGAV